MASNSGEKPTYPIESVDSALRLLRLVVERKKLRVAEASSELGVARSTAHRLLRMLQYHGFVEQDLESRRYGTGPVLVNLALQTLRDMDIRGLARPHMQQLVAEVGETVHLLELQPGGDLLCLESVESVRVLRVGSRIGMQLPAFASAGGRAILALMSDAEVCRLYPDERLPPRHATTVSSRADLLAQLAIVREQGYAVQHEETTPQVSAVGAAIRDASGRAGFGLTVAIPTSRMDAIDVRKVGQAVVVCADRVSASLPS